MTAHPNGTVPWFAMLRWLDAQDGTATLERVIKVWGYSNVLAATSNGDVDTSEYDVQPRTITLTKYGRAKL
jgi:hypothetical protein